MYRLILFFGFIVGLAGCSLKPEPVAPQTAETQVLYQLRPPLDVGFKPMQLSQLVTFTVQGHQQTVPFLLDLNEQRLLLSALTSWGTPLFVLQYDGQKVSYNQPPVMETGLRPEYILSDLILTYWPLESITPLLRGTGLTVEQNQQERLVRNQQQVLIQISYTGSEPWLAHVHLKNHPLGYQLEIKPLNNE